MIADLPVTDDASLFPDATIVDAMDGGRFEDAASNDAGEDQVVEGNVTNPAACEDVCDDFGLACNDAHQWFVGEGGAFLDYSNGSCVFTESCEFLPGLMLAECFMPGNYTLTRHRCACK